MSSFDLVDIRSNREKQIEREAYASLSLGPEIDPLVAELVEIGRNCDFFSNPGGSFDNKGYNIRAREIGTRLNEIGGIELMQLVYYRAMAILGPGFGRSLEVAWEYIGDWWP